MIMKKTVLILFLGLLAGISAAAQTVNYRVLETGWGRIEKSYRQSTLVELGVGEMNIPRWRKTSGTLRIDFDRKEVVLSIRGKKDKTFTLLSESRPFATRDGWSYVDYMGLDGNNSVCHFWLCKHESGAQRLLTLYPWMVPDTVYGYRLELAE